MCSQYDPAWGDVTPEQAAYAEQRVAELMRPLRDADTDGTLAAYLPWLADDSIMAYRQAILDNTWSQLETSMSDGFAWAAAQLTTPRRRAVFGELLMHTGEGDVWPWLLRWPGLRPMDVGEDPNVVNAWDSGVFDPTPAADDAGATAVDSAYVTYGDQPNAEQVYTMYQHDHGAEPAYTEYRDET